jgi:hypothetical protein
VFSRTYLTYVRAAKRVQRVWLHPGQQLRITDFNHYKILDPGFRRGDDVLSAACQEFSPQKRRDRGGFYGIFCDFSLRPLRSLRQIII